MSGKNIIPFRKSERKSKLNYICNCLINYDKLTESEYKEFLYTVMRYTATVLNVKNVQINFELEGRFDSATTYLSAKEMFFSSQIEKKPKSLAKFMNVINVISHEYAHIYDMENKLLKISGASNKRTRVNSMELHYPCEDIANYYNLNNEDYQKLEDFDYAVYYLSPFEVFARKIGSEFAKKIIYKIVRDSNKGKKLTDSQLKNLQTAYASYKTTRFFERDLNYKTNKKDFVSNCEFVKKLYYNYVNSILNSSENTSNPKEFFSFYENEIDDIMIEEIIFSQNISPLFNQEQCERLLSLCKFKKEYPYQLSIINILNFRYKETDLKHALKGAIKKFDFDFHYIKEICYNIDPIYLSQLYNLAVKEINKETGTIIIR